jgi:hypothetical protein
MTAGAPASAVRRSEMKMKRLHVRLGDNFDPGLAFDIAKRSKLRW